jgi:hypothetical protein
MSLYTSPSTQNLAPLLIKNVIFQGIIRVFLASGLVTTYLLSTHLGGH